MIVSYFHAQSENGNLVLWELQATRNISLGIFVVMKSRKSLLKWRKKKMSWEKLIFFFAPENIFYFFCYLSEKHSQFIFFFLLNKFTLGKTPRILYSRRGRIIPKYNMQTIFFFFAWKCVSHVLLSSITCIVIR